jgi:hypothetical protein
MMRDNLADISTFESLQENQHNRTNMSSMSVFNDMRSIESMHKQMVDLETQREKASNDVVKKQLQIYKAETELTALKKAHDELRYKMRAVNVRCVDEVRAEVDRINKMPDDKQRQEEADRLRKVAEKIEEDVNLFGYDPVVSKLK